MNTITILTGDKPTRKSFPKEGKLNPYFHEVEVREIESLLDIKNIIEENRHDEHKYFIRNIPITYEDDGSFLRRKVNTKDTALNWIMLDIDGVDTDLPIRSYLIEELPFIKEDTAMLIDYSSKQGVYGDGQDYRNKNYAHVYLWSDTAFTNQEWKDRLIGFDFIDTAMFHQVQAHYFVEPKISEPYRTELTQRTIYIPGKDFTPPKPPLLEKEDFAVSAHKGGKTTNLEMEFKKLIRPGKRNNGLHTLFCKVVAKGADQEYWINKYWNSPLRSPDHDEIHKVTTAMDNAKEYVYRIFKDDVPNNFPTIHLEEMNLQEAIKYELGTNYFIKSGMMTFKTQSLKNIPETTNGRPTRILLVGHRVNLIRGTAKELNLEIYNELGETEEVDGEEHPRRFWREDRLAITFDSLWRAFKNDKAPEYDWLILDESEQMIIELLTTTRTQEESPGFEHKKKQQTSELASNLGRTIQASKSTVCLDADLGRTTTWFVENWKTSNFVFYHNKYQSLKDRKFQLIPTIEKTWGHIENEIRKGKRVYINCDTKTKALALHKHLETTFDPKSQRKGRPPKGLIIHGDNSGLNKHKEIAENPNEKLPDLMRRGLKWFITTPTFETGISIGKPELEEWKFHSAYLLWTWNNYTANTARQAICRVRNADNYYVYIPPGFDTPLNITKLLEFAENQRSQPRSPDYVEEIKRYCKQREENSLTNRILHFQLLIEEIGGVLVRVNPELDIYPAYNECMKAIKDEEIEKILQATDIKDEEEYKELGFSQEDRYKRYRFECQKTFNTKKINKEMINHWDFGRIEHKWKLRNLLGEDIKDIEMKEDYQELSDSQGLSFIHKALSGVIEDFGIEDIHDTKIEKVLLEEHISEDTLDWLCSEDVLKVLKFLLNHHHLDIGEVQKLKAEPLRLYRKLGSLLDFSITHFGAHDKRIISPLSDRNEIAEGYKKNKIFEQYGYVGLEDKSEINKATDEIIKRRIIDRADDLSKTEINYYRKRNKHLLLKQYKPMYVGRLRKNLSDDISYIGKMESDKKTNTDQTVAGFQIC